MEIDSERLQKAVLGKLNKWLESMSPEERDKPFVILDKSFYTPNMIVKNVEQGTPQGERFFQRWLELMIGQLVKYDVEGRLEDERDPMVG